MAKKILRPVVSVLMYGVMRVVEGVCARSPLRVVGLISGLLGGIVYAVARKPRATADSNLRLVFPSMPPRGRSRFVRRYFLLLVQAILEMFYYVGHQQRVIPDVRITGKEHLDAALACGKGVIGLTAHYGNFALMDFRLVREGYPLHIMLRPLRDARFNAHLREVIVSHGAKLIYSLPRKDAVSGVLRALRGNGLVVILLDQDFHKAGVTVSYFGRPASTAAGPALLAMRTHAKIIPMFIVREQSGGYCVHILPEAKVVAGADQADTIFKTTQHFSDIIEDFVRRYPAEWAWVHRRWRA